MQEIWKFPFEPIIQMPKGTTILTIQYQYQRPTLWASVDPEQPDEKRTFSIVGTGQLFPDNEWKYIGTLQEGIFVWHYYDTTKG